MSLPSAEKLQELLGLTTHGTWEYRTYDYCPDLITQDQCDAHGRQCPDSMTFDCGCGDEQETCQTQHYIVGGNHGVIAWNPEFDEPPNPFDMAIAALAPELAAEVIRLRKELARLQQDMRRQPHDYLANEVGNAIRNILEGESNDHTH